MDEYIIYYRMGGNGQGAETVFATNKRAATTIFRRTCKQRKVVRTITRIVVLSDEE